MWGEKVSKIAHHRRGDDLGEEAEKHEVGGRKRRSKRQVGIFSLIQCNRLKIILCGFRNRVVVIEAVLF